MTRGDNKLQIEKAIKNATSQIIENARMGVMDTKFEGHKDNRRSMKGGGGWQ